MFRKEFAQKRIEFAAGRLPQNFVPFTDKYFTRTWLMLDHLKYNPWVRTQVSIRSKPGVVAGIYDVLAALYRYTDFLKNGGRVWAVEEGEKYENEDTVLVIEGWARDYVELETILLGLLASSTTAANDGFRELDLESIKKLVLAIRRALYNPTFKQRTLDYMGARHYHWSADEKIVPIFWEAGGNTCSTDRGAETIDRQSPPYRHQPDGISSWSRESSC